MQDLAFSAPLVFYRLTDDRGSCVPVRFEREGEQVCRVSRLKGAGEDSAGGQKEYNRHRPEQGKDQRPQF
jgi:hypothetical protein